MREVRGATEPRGLLIRRGQRCTKDTEDALYETCPRLTSRRRTGAATTLCQRFQTPSLQLCNRANQTDPPRPSYQGQRPRKEVSDDKFFNVLEVLHEQLWRPLTDDLNRGQHSREIAAEQIVVACSIHNTLEHVLQVFTPDAGDSCELGQSHGRVLGLDSGALDAQQFQARANLRLVRASHVQAVRRVSCNFARRRDDILVAMRYEPRKFLGGSLEGVRGATSQLHQMFESRSHQNDRVLVVCGDGRGDKVQHPAHMLTSERLLGNFHQEQACPLVCRMFTTDALQDVLSYRLGVSRRRLHLEQRA
mmetsp:Transcript_10290/g.16473  ORF Transcript_10290/g.16473 Transcript_10290/m.16473 type:complete len:306 (+) Transcript_10290:1202-2119(+)